MSRRKQSLTPDKVAAFAEQFATLLRADGWKVDVVRARNMSNPEDIVLMTIRMGKKATASPKLPPIRDTPRGDE